MVFGKQWQRYIQLWRRGITQISLPVMSTIDLLQIISIQLKMDCLMPHIVVSLFIIDFIELSLEIVSYHWGGGGAGGCRYVLVECNFSQVICWSLIISRRRRRPGDGRYCNGPHLSIRLSVCTTVRPSVRPSVTFSFRTVIRHSPPGMPYGFVRIYFYFVFIFLFVFFRRQGFRMITFDRQAGPLQNLNRSQVMVIGRSVSFSDPARPPFGGVGRPKHPKIPPPPNLCVRFRTPGTFLRFKTPGRCFCGKYFSVTEKLPPPRPRPALRTLTSILVQ